MFINRWLEIDSVERMRTVNKPKEVYFLFKGLPENSGNLINALQLHHWNTPFAIILPGNLPFQPDKYEQFSEALIRLFFLSGYYTHDFMPVLFITEKSSAINRFLQIADQKCKNQGFPAMYVFDANPASTAYTRWVGGDTIDLKHLISQWNTDYFEDRNPPEIHLLVPASEAFEEALLQLASAQMELQKAEGYTMASFLYNKQREIAAYRHQLYLTEISVRNTQLYLSIQKEERANGLKWYYNEYEILPIWYKKFGHIIKVITGKRSFKSLFSDKVKKHKD